MRSLILLLVPVFCFAQWGNKKVEKPRGVYDYLQQDASTEAMITIDYAHHEIHEGSHFKAGYSNTAMDTNDTLAVLFITPNTTTWAHWTLTSQVTSAAVLQVFEGPTSSANGTAVTRFNRNRNSADTSVVRVYHTPTFSANGTKLAEKWIGASGGLPHSVGTGSEFRGDSEIILRQNTKYLLLLIAKDDAMKGAIGGDWYEHTDKN